MYYAYFVSAFCRGLLYLLLIALVLRQFLPFVGKRPSEFEKYIEKATHPLLFAGDSFCRMLSIPLYKGGIDFRYPVIALFLWICVIAVEGVK